MTTRLKKIIARKGLILLLCLIPAFLFSFLLYGYTIDKPDSVFEPRMWVFFFVFLTILIYLPTRFIVWAIKTLKNKE